ncbi:MAG TPA: hypothetical protein VHX88_11605 [Solirubrobacteraceae bacterium]|jgi:hypothetical protein|nr:hypothetical protein [Solirubrobacteraceae bacterium]
MRPLRSTVPAAVALTALLAGGASWAAAQTAPSGTAIASPSSAGAAAHLLISASGSTINLGTALPKGVTIEVARGYGVNLAAASRCSATQAKGNACPASSRVATGSITGTASALGLSEPIDATLDAYLTAPTGGSEADVIVTAQAFGVTLSARGEVLALSGPTYGTELKFDPLPSVTLPLGAVFKLREVSLNIGARGTERVSRCVRHAHGRCTRHQTGTQSVSLLTNPKTCTSAGWPGLLQVRSASGTQSLTASIACTNAAH